MSRKNEFRAFDTRIKVMYPFVILGWNGAIEARLNPDDCNTIADIRTNHLNGTFDDYDGGIIIFENTNLKDKNGKEGYFDLDIWQVKNYAYSVVSSRDRKGNVVMMTTKKIDLRFILIKGLLKVEYKIINHPGDLDVISLDVIFNFENKEGKRRFVDNFRENCEIIGNIYDNPELLSE